jgi:O-antigen/teichoic acid export membrane protein
MRGASFLRYRGIFLGGAFAGLSKLTSLVTVAISVPLTIRYLSSEQYGLWMTISSLAALLSFADMGLGNGLMTALAESLGRSDSIRAVRLVSSAFYMLLGLSILIATTFLGVYFFVPWAKVFGATNPGAAGEAASSMLTFALCLVAGLPLSVVQRVQMGLQQSWRAYLWQSAASIVSLIWVLIAAYFKSGVLWLLLAMNGGPVLVGALNFFVEFWFRRPEMRPTPVNCDPAVVKALFGSGGLFVGLQLFSALGTATDSVVIARMFGAAAVGPYAVMYKLFQTSLVFSLFMFPLWPALGEALARGDYAWARLALSRAVLLSVAAGTSLAVLLLLFGRALVRVWVGSRISIDPWLLSGFCGWIILSAYGGGITSLMNNTQFLRLQFKIYGVASIAALSLKIPMAHWIGPAGVVWATVIAYSLGYCLPAGLAARRFFQSTMRSPPSDSIASQ